MRNVTLVAIFVGGVAFTGALGVLSSISATSSLAATYRTGILASFLMLAFVSFAQVLLFV